MIQNIRVPYELDKLYIYPIRGLTYTRHIIEFATSVCLSVTNYTLR